MAAKKNNVRRLRIEINLLPVQYRKVAKDFSWLTDRRVVWPTIALVVFIVAIMLVYGYTLETTSSLKADLDSVKASVERERPLLSKISDLEKTQAVVNTKIRALKSIQVSKKRWVVLFENVSSVLPPNMWITSLNQVGEFNLEMRGTTFDFSEVAEYMVKLEKQSSIESVSLVTISTAKVDGDEAYNFTIKIVLKRVLEEG